MRTFVEHISNRIAFACKESKNTLANNFKCPSVLVTGGGAFNKTLMASLKQKITGIGAEIKECDDQTIEFKEALIFAFLGLRCILGQENISKEVTGSRSDSVSGSVHRPLSHGKHPTKFEKCYFEFKRLRERKH